MSGKVFLVGCGPGDPELLTLKAVKAIGRAEVLLVDDLVGDAVLDFARAGARVIHAGKRGGCASTPQEFIERLMVVEARAGRVVARLKGGDPFVFGRGGEEVAALREAGVDCEVVNGITAGLAAPSSLGIPLTHRGLAQGVVLVTGHAGDGMGEPDWHALAASRLPLVIYMGVARAGAIRAALLAAGMRESMPVVVMQNATREDARSLVTTLANLRVDLAKSGLGSPAIMLVGETVSLANSSTGAASRPKMAGEARGC